MPLPGPPLETGFGWKRDRRAAGGFVPRQSQERLEGMDEFASRFDNKIDGKGRVSIPASFRAVLAKEGAEEIFCYPHLDRSALEAGGGRLVEKIKGILDSFAIDSPERDEIATAYFGESEKIKVDPDGRAVLPKRLRDHAGITDIAVFVGLGDKFQIWAPTAYEEFRAEARERRAPTGENSARGTVQ